MKNFYCSLFGHDYKVSKNVTYHVKELKCKHCKSELTTGGNGKMIPLTPKFKEINSILNGVHKKRLKNNKKFAVTNS